MSVIPTFVGDMSSGFGYARDKGVAVMNNSWGDQGGYFQQIHSPILEDAITSAINLGRGGKGMIVVFASGNQYKNGIDYPGSSNPDILTVGSISSNGKRTNFSSYGSNLDVVAPGNNILSTLPGNIIDFNSGTSMAAPHAAGVAALVLSVNPELTGKQVRDIIESTSQKVGGYSYNTTKVNGTWNVEMGYGLINAYAAVQKAQQTQPPIGCTTTQVINRTFSAANEYVTGCDVYFRNVVVKGGTKLTINKKETWEVLPNYTLERNGLLEVSRTY